MKICVVTGSRAEFGLLLPVILQLKRNSSVEVQLLATGTHLSPAFGMTINEIGQHGLEVDWEVEMLVSSDTASGTVKSMGLAMMGFSEAFRELKPDVLLVLGDRFEIFCAAASATIFNLPIAHIHGGEVTHGAFDDALRHSITKMASVHFVSTKIYKQRVLQMGEDPRFVHNVGSLGVHNAKSIDKLDKTTLEEEVGIQLQAPVAVVTYHSVTKDDDLGMQGLDALIDVLNASSLGSVVVTAANADVGGQKINQKLRKFVDECKVDAVFVQSLGMQRYLSLLTHADLVLGNSSSGVIEAPSFGLQVIDIGERQAGRVCSERVYRCSAKVAAIQKAMDHALSQLENSERDECDNPYDQGDPVKQICESLVSLDLHELRSVEFQDLQWQPTGESF